MNAYTTHASIRVKGTENNYEPTQCFDTTCPHQASPHMHCPFCPNSDFYNDPVILRAHYRVKHVDKSIDFAGLKALRCCDHCDIVGIIKGQKAFKGAHWHCYKCKNGFNRRDEALKHYRTHFRNPQTTFQIQIPQDVHGSNINSPVSVIENRVESNLSKQGNVGNSRDGEIQVSVAANEEVDDSNSQTIMIIQQDQFEGEEFAPEVIEPIEGNADQVPGRLLVVLQQKHEVELQLDEMAKKLRKVEQERDTCVTEMEQMKVKFDLEMKTMQQREQALIAQLSVIVDERVAELLQQMKQSHENLLHQQMATLKQAYLVSLSSEPAPMYVYAPPVKREKVPKEGSVLAVNTSQQHTSVAVEEAEQSKGKTAANKAKQSDDLLAESESSLNDDVNVHYIVEPTERIESEVHQLGTGTVDEAENELTLALELPSDEITVPSLDVTENIAKEIEESHVEEEKSKYNTRRKFQDSYASSVPIKKKKTA